MAHPSAPRQRWEPLPRLVDQLRILLWFQFYLTLINTLAVFGYMAIVDGHRRDSYDDLIAWELFTQREEQVVAVALIMLGSAIVLAICARLARHRSVVLYPFVIVAELGVLYGLIRAIQAEVYAGIGVALVVLLGGWILTDLFRGEVGAFLRGQRPGSVVAVNAETAADQFGAV